MNLTTLKKSWFFLTFCSDITLGWVILKLINNLPDFIISADKKRQLSSVICFLLFRIIFYLNPQIKIKSSVNWDLLGEDPFVILINHTSPLDSIFFASMCPLKYAPKLRTLAKAELFQMPVLGDLLTYCGHFPVHFLRSELGHFSVDKEKQTKVIQDIRKHLGSGGSIAFFPEGQLNRFDTRNLQPFRTGLFKIFSELDISNRLEATLTASKSVNTMPSYIQAWKKHGMLLIKWAVLQQKLIAK